MASEREVESYLRMAGRAAAMANASADPWLKTQWQEIADAYRDVAQNHMRGARSTAQSPPERGKVDG
jgi:hypothetical protein